MGNERSSMLQTSYQEVLAPFHAQEKLLTSSSWVSQVPNFRQEIRQSNYRNDTAKYDLAFSPKVRDISMFPVSDMLWDAYKLHCGWVLAEHDSLFQLQLVVKVDINSSKSLNICHMNMFNSSDNTIFSWFCSTSALLKYGIELPPEIMAGET